MSDHNNICRLGLDAYVPKLHIYCSCLLRWARLYVTFSLVTLLFAITFYVTTIVYSRDPEIFSRCEAIGSSPARALGFLAILVQVGGIFLAASINSAFSVLTNVLLARFCGNNLLSHLALHPGTGFEGWVEILRRRPWNKLCPRAWTIVRILAITIVPVLGIVIMSDVNTTLSFYAVPSAQPARSYSIGEFNASLALILQPMADEIFSTRFKDFLSDSDLVIDITRARDRAQCGDINNVQRGCRTQYFLPGGTENGAPLFLNNTSFRTFGSIQPVLALNKTGYVFDFRDGIEIQSGDEFTERDCVKSGFSIGAFQLCLKNVASHEIQALVMQCPRAFSSNLQCMNSTAWPSINGWRTNLSISTRRANIGYNGLNGTILSHSFVGEEKNVSIDAKELLNVFDMLLNKRIDTTTGFGELIQALNLSSNRPAAPFTIWQYFQGLGDLSNTNPWINRRALLGLQSLLAIPLYHCQDKDFAEMRRMLLRQIDSDSAVGQLLWPKIVDSLPDPRTDTDIVPAKIRWNLIVGKATIIAYGVLSGTALVLCLTAQIVGSCTNIGQRVRYMGTFPLLDREADYEIVEDREGAEHVVDHEFFHGLGIEDRLPSTADMRVRLVERPVPQSSREASVVVSESSMEAGLLKLGREKGFLTTDSSRAKTSPF